MPTRSTRPSQAVMKTKGMAAASRAVRLTGFGAEVRVDRSELREGTLQAPDAAGQSVNLIALFECRDSGTYGVDNARQIKPKDGRKRMPRVRRASTPDLEVKWINTARLDTDEHLPRGG